MLARSTHSSSIPIILDRWLHKGRPAIGLDFGTHTLKALQLEGGRGRWSVRAAAEQPLPANLPDHGPARVDAYAEAIQRALDEAPFAGRQVVTTLPSSSVTYKSLRLPTMPDHELAAAVEFEAADRMEIGDAGCLVQHFNAGQVRQGNDVRQEVIAMAVSQQAMDEHIQALARCGLEPEAIDVAPGALARCAVLAARADDAPADTNLIVDIGFNTSKVVIARHGRVLFFKEIDIAGLQFAEAGRQDAPPRATATDDAEAQPSDEDAGPNAVSALLEQLSREIGLCLRYYSVTFRGERPREALLVGGEATRPQIVKGLATLPGVGFRVLDVFADVELGRMDGRLSRGDAGAPWAIAASLSRRAAMLERKRGKAA